MKYKREIREEQKSSGISPERTELDALLEEIFEREEVAENAQQATNEEKK